MAGSSGWGVVSLPRSLSNVAATAAGSGTSFLSMIQPEAQRVPSRILWIGGLLPEPRDNAKLRAVFSTFGQIQGYASEGQKAKGTIYQWV